MPYASPSWTCRKRMKYEQICVWPEDVPKTAFATIYVTFVSHVMQQGDCNALSTFQRLMTSMFCNYVTTMLQDLSMFTWTTYSYTPHQSRSMSTWVRCLISCGKPSCT